MDKVATRRSIVDRIRTDAFNDGWAQAAQVAHDDAYERGVRETAKRAARQSTWAFRLGLVAGFILALIFGALL